MLQKLNKISSNKYTLKFSFILILLMYRFLKMFFQSDNGGKQSQYFNIYSDWEPSNECDLDSIARKCTFISIQ